MLSDRELSEARDIIRRGLDEDLRYGPDVTTTATVPADAVAKASVVPRDAGVVAGVDVALLVLDEVIGVDGYQVLDRVEDGARLQSGQPLLTVHAETRGLLTAERTMLNLVCHLSGIATTTAAWVDAVAGHQGQDPRHPQDPARPACAAEVRGARRRRRQPPAGARGCRVDQGQPRGGRGLGGGRAARGPRRRTRSAVRGRGGLARATRRRAGRRPRADPAGQLPGVADPDGRAAPGRPRSRRSARVVRRAQPGKRGDIRRDGRGLPGRRGADPLGARPRHRPRTCSNARAAGLAACSAAGSPAMRDRISAPSINEITASATVFASFSDQSSERSRSSIAAHQPANARADAARTSGLAFTDSVAIGSIGQPSRWSPASPATNRSIHRSTMSATGRPLSRNRRSSRSMSAPAASTTAAASSCLPCGKW